MTSASSGQVRTEARVTGMVELTKREGAPRTRGHGYLALSGLDAARPVAVARIGGLGRTLVAGAGQERFDLWLAGVSAGRRGGRAR